MAVDITMRINAQAYPVTLDERNDAVEDFVRRLPLTLRFEDYGSTERISYLPEKLDVGSAPSSTVPKTGDVCYYAPWGNLAVFLKPFRRSEGLVPLGRMNAEALEALRKSGDAAVIFEKRPQH